LAPIFVSIYSKRLSVFSPASTTTKYMLTTEFLEFRVCILRDE